MSRKSRERWLEAQERWPELQQFMAAQFNQDAVSIWGSLDAALHDGVNSRRLDHRQQVIREWWDWNKTAAWKGDIRSLLSDGLGVDWNFSSQDDARKFVNAIYDALIVSIRNEAGKDWKP